MRTSATHPLLIAAVPAGASLGRVGLTFCPGKHQPDAMTGGWARDLGVDLDAVAAWGAAALVTLVERHELAALRVEGLGAAAEDRHLRWFHLPIQDVTAPGAAFEDAWGQAGPQLRRMLRAGFDVVVHCKGGLGRAGTVAARLLVELGWGADDAIRAVRAARPGAIEVESQAAHVRAQAARDDAPDASAAAVRNRAVGAVLGLAVGDAVGTTLEFAGRDTRARLTDMVGGGPFRLPAGAWTDDTAMALALADSLAAHPGLDEADLMARFADWADDGDYNCTGSCFDIGNTVNAAVARYRRTGNPIAGDDHPMSAGNGSLMRLGPVAARWFRDRDTLRDVAARQSRVTHAAAEAVDACVGYAELLADAIQGHDVWRPRDTGFAPKVAAVLAGSWRGAARGDVRGSGYVVDALEAALWAVGRGGDYAHAVLAAANLGEDADTTAAIAGQLAGALGGVAAIPAAWRAKLVWRDRIEAVAGRLADAALA